VRDLLVFALFVGVLPLSLLRPWVGICAFTFLAYNRTQDLTWGFARSLPISQLIAVAMIIGWITIEYRPIPFRFSRIKAMVLLLLVVMISIIMNQVRWEAQGHRFSDLVKVIFVSLLTGAFLINRFRLRTLMAVMSLALGFYGAKNGVMYALGGSSIAGPGGMLKDNNDFALAMVMNVPLLFYLSNEMKPLKYGKYISIFMKAACLLSLLTIMSTGSRGGFLALGVTMLIMALKTKWKLPALALLVIVGLAGAALAPKEYQDRIASIFVSTGERDSSAQGRLTSWLVATNMIQANPVWGIGFSNMVYDYNRYTQGVYNEEGSTDQKARVSHNSYFQIWAESGTIAFLLFMFMIVGSIVSLGVLRLRSKRNGDLWVIPYCDAIQVSMCAFMVGATFLNRAHFDFIYQLIVVATVLPVVIQAERKLQKQVSGKKRSRLAQDVWVRDSNPFVKVN
jgi:probable O-glycosylation ligase (exosortase A-associated)